MKKKHYIITAIASLIVLTGTILIFVPTQPEGNTAVAELTNSYGTQYESGSIGSRYKIYEKYGLTYDEANDSLTYQGQTVRYFIDEYSLGDGSTSIVNEHFDESGTIDLYAERNQANVNRNKNGSYDPSGTISDVKMYSQEEFEARDLEVLKHPVSQGAESGVPLTPEEQAKLYSEYEPFGLSYNKDTNELTYQGKSVRYFLDVRSSNGEAMNGGNFEGSITSMLHDENGSLDVNTVRDFTITNADGEGKLTGLEAYTSGL